MVRRTIHVAQSIALIGSASSGYARLGGSKLSLILGSVITFSSSKHPEFVSDFHNSLIQTIIEVNPAIDDDFDSK